MSSSWVKDGKTKGKDRKNQGIPSVRWLPSSRSSSRASPPPNQISSTSGVPHESQASECNFMSTLRLRPLAHSSNSVHSFVSPSQLPDNQEETSSEEVTNPQNKDLVEPDGDRGFLPSKFASRAITKVIRSRYNQPWSSWKEIPEETREN